ncbi:MAG: hypothetical protein WCV84_03540 [Patescibacteria group bacterium]
MEKRLRMVCAVVCLAALVGCGTYDSWLEEPGDAASSGDVAAVEVAADSGETGTQDASPTETASAEDATDAGTVVQPDTGVLVQDTGVADSGSVPSDTGAIPSDTGTVSVDTGTLILPDTSVSDTGTLVQDTGTVPSDTGTLVPQDTGTLVQDTGTASVDTGVARADVPVTPADSGSSCGTACFRGVGVCQTTGTTDCTSGTPQCNAPRPPLPSSRERCGNRLDDDCDGATDEAQCE